MQADNEAKAMKLIQQNIEHIEMSFLKAIAEGPGYPAFTIFDLDDPAALDRVRKLRPPEEIDDALVNAEVRGVRAAFVFLQVLIEPYDVGDKWWNGTPPGRFPVAVLTDGGITAIARANPEGTDEALRQRLLVKHTPTAIQQARDAEARGEIPVLITIADLRDPTGRSIAERSLGADRVRETLAITEDFGGAAAVATVAIWPGVPTSPNFPMAWGGPISPGKVAVQVVAYGGISKTVIEVAGVG